MTDKKLLDKRVMNFFFKKEECRSLSNFWKCDIVLNDDTLGESRTYDSGESCFHGEKFIRLGKCSNDEDRKYSLINYGRTFLKDVCHDKDGNTIKKMGRKFTLTLDELALWDILSIEVQVEICNYKINHYECVKNDLLSTMDKILIHPALRCSEDKLRHRLWEGKAVVIDGNIHVLGKNMLGNIWMDIRLLL